ncbi:MAG: hypothetical protein GY847_16410 [Proteobacteria bacterium]|nr:hypothetical protein [Pseudomonadota bacterium]
MNDEDKTAEKISRADQPDAVSTVDATEEPWLPIETKLVVRSVVMGIILLIVLAALVNILLLGGH